jgi:hypothetical protein
MEDINHFLQYIYDYNLNRQAPVGLGLQSNKYIYPNQNNYHIRIRADQTKDENVPLKPVEYLMIIINKVKNRFSSLHILLINNIQAILEIFINKKKIYVGIQYYSQDANFRYYYVVLKQKREDINVWFKNEARITPFHNFRKPTIYYKYASSLSLIDIKILYNKLDKVINQYLQQRSSVKQANYSIIDLIVLDDETSNNYNLELILQERYNVKLYNESYINKEYFEKFVCDDVRGVCYEFKKGNTILFYLGIIKFSYEMKNMISFLYHNNIDIFAKILKYYPSIYKYLKIHGESFYNEELDQLIEYSQIKDIEDINKIIDVRIKKYLNFNDVDNAYTTFLRILHYYNVYISGGFILSKILELTNIYDDNLFMFIKYQLLDKFIEDLLRYNFSIRLVKLLKIDIPIYEQICCCIECILNGIKIYIFVLGKEFNYKTFFYGEQKNSLNAWFIKTYVNNKKENDLIIQFIIDKNKHIGKYGFLKEQYNLLAEKYFDITKVNDFDLSFTNNDILYKILIIHLIGYHNNYKKIIDLFIIEYVNNYELDGDDPIDMYISILLGKEIEQSQQKIHHIILNILLNCHINEKDMEREHSYINYIIGLLLKFKIKGGTGNKLITDFIRFMHSFNMEKLETLSPLIINLNLAEDVKYNNVNNDPICMDITNNNEIDITNISDYLDNDNNLLFILPGNKLMCTTKTDLIQWITTRENDRNYRIYIRSINKIEHDYYVKIQTQLGGFYMLCSYIYIILLSQTRVFKFDEVPNTNISLIGPYGFINVSNIKIVKCSRVENYKEIILSKIEPIL